MDMDMSKTAAEKQPGAIRCQVKRIEKFVEELSSEISSLEERLSPALVPETAAPVGDEPDEDPKPRSPIVNELDGLAERIDHQSRRVRDLTAAADI